LSLLTLTMASKMPHLPPLLAGLLVGALLLSPVNAAELNPTALKAWRQPALDRQRRIIFNNDGCEIFLLKQATKEALLAARTTPLLGTQVDSIFYCTTQGFGLFTHFTKAGQIFLTREGRYGQNEKNDNRMPALLAAGVDPLQAMVDFSRQHGLEVFCSFRMNDNHDGSSADYGPIRFKYNTVKSAHPDYLLGQPGQQLKYGGWSAVDYGRPEVRELMFRYVEEVCRNYDVDGIELDFFRHPVFFKSTTRGEPASNNELAAMTALVRRIRRVADEEGLRRGRPLLIAMHLPDSVEYARTIGLDLERWLEDDLMDLLIVSGYFQLNDWNYSVALARKYGVKVYPSLDEPRLKDNLARTERQAERTYMARAAVAWQAGVNGIYMFNYFSDSNLKFELGGSVLRTIGDPRLLASTDKDYFASARGVGVASFGNYPLAAFQAVETLNPGAPRTILPKSQASVRLQLGAEIATEPFELKLGLRLDDLPASGVTVSLNGRELQSPHRAGIWLEFPIEQTWVRPGENQVEVQRRGGGKAPLKWTDLVLHAKRKK
jgi:hypothetical protein